MYEWVLATIIVFFASVLQAATGFGFAIMATPFLLLVFNSRECIQISIILSFVVSLLLISKVGKDVDKGLLKQLIFGSIIGAPFGVLFFKLVSLDIMKIAVCIIILIVTFFLMIKSLKNHWEIKESSDSKIFTNCKNHQIWDVNNISVLKTTQLFVGFCSGLLTTSIGMPGVPIILYYNATKTKKEIARSTALYFFVIVHIISMAMQLLTTNTDIHIVISSFVLIPVASAGVFVGNILFHKINQVTFQRIAYGILLFTGFYMLIKTFKV